MILVKKQQPFLMTKRCKVIPLYDKQIEMHLTDPNNFYHTLGLISDDYPLPAALKETFETKISDMKADPEFMAFHTIWAIIQLEEKHIVGYLYFKDRPSKTGMVELTGFIKPAYRRKGYMLESSAILRKWAFNKKDVIMMLSYFPTTDDISRSLVRKSGYSHWREHPVPEGMELWCCEKPFRPSSRIGVLLGIGTGSIIALILKIKILIPGLIGMMLGVLFCAYIDGKEQKRRYELLRAELEEAISLYGTDEQKAAPAEAVTKVEEANQAAEMRQIAERNKEKKKIRNPVAVAVIAILLLLVIIYFYFKGVPIML